MMLLSRLFNIRLIRQKRQLEERELERLCYLRAMLISSRHSSRAEIAAKMTKRIDEIQEGWSK